MKKAWASHELAQLFVTGPTDLVGTPNHFCCQLCRRDVSVLTHGSFEILRHFQCEKHFAMDQGLRLETIGWRVLVFSGNRLPDDEVERQRSRNIWTSLVRRDREYPFCGHLITDDAGVVDPQLHILAKVSSLLESLPQGRSYDLVEQLWSQFP